MHGNRKVLRDARGFSMVELLVVLLLLGILATITLPAFLSQRAKGQDSEAQSTVRTAVIALRTFETDHHTFDATRADLELIEPTLGEATADFSVSGTETAFTVTERSTSGTEFTLARDFAGNTTRTCNEPGHGRCRSALDAAGNRW
jgi:type IV pilus assembly protein PilA